ncbi:unnamed protein product, partial [Musa hybrid cultivar]
MGYRDGTSAGNEASAQEGFNIGFKQSASSGYKWGIVSGITSAFVSLPDQFKEKLLKKLEDRGRFQSLYQARSRDFHRRCSGNYVSFSTATRKYTISSK